METYFALSSPSSVLITSAYAGYRLEGTYMVKDIPPAIKAKARLLPIALVFAWILLLASLLYYRATAELPKFENVYDLAREAGRTGSFKQVNRDSEVINVDDVDLDDFQFDAVF